MEEYAVRKFVMLRKEGDQVSLPVPVMIELSRNDLGTIHKAVTYVNTSPEVSMLIIRLRPSVVCLDDGDAAADLKNVDSVTIQIDRGQLISLEVESSGYHYVSDVVNRPYPDMIQTDVVVGDEFKASFSRDHDFRESLEEGLDKDLYGKLLKEI